MAAELGHEDVCEILLEHNAFVNVRNKSGMTPLHLAAKMGFNNMIKQLINNHGALIDAMTLVSQNYVHNIAYIESNPKFSLVFTDKTNPVALGSRVWAA